MTVLRSIAIGRDAEENEVYDVQTLIEDRPARKYRERGAEIRWVREGVRYAGVVAFRFHDGDDIKESDAILVDGVLYGITLAKRMDLWKRSCHWEIELEQAR